MFTLLSGPYSLIARILAVILIVVGVFLYGFTKGISHQQERDEIAKAKEIEVAEQVHQKQMNNAHAISQTYQEQLQDEKAHSDALNHALQHALSLRLYLPTHSQQGSADRSSPDGQAGSRSVDIRFSEAVQHDASHYAGCVNQLNALIDTIKVYQ